jgi:hypothetical protein
MWKPKYTYIIDSSVKHFVDWQQCKGNPLSHFCGSTEHFYIFDSCIYVNNSTKGMYCCISMATVVMWMRHNVMLYVRCLSCYVYIVNWAMHACNNDSDLYSRDVLFKYQTGHTLHLPRKSLCMGIVHLKEHHVMMFALIFVALFCLFCKTNVLQQQIK